VERGKEKGGREWENTRSQMSLFVRRTGLWLSLPRFGVLHVKGQLQKLGDKLESLGKYLMVWMSQSLCHLFRIVLGLSIRWLTVLLTDKRASVHVNILPLSKILRPE
jgi:hypothetical protein